MAPRKKKQAELTGFAVGQRTGRTKKYSCDLEGFEGFEFEMKRLTFADIDSLPAMVTKDDDGKLHGLTHHEAWEAMAPLIVGWNAQAETPDGSWEDVPPPAEAGVEVFQLVEPEISEWMYGKVKYGHLSPALPKEPTPSESTPETADA